MFSCKCFGKRSSFLRKLYLEYSVELYFRIFSGLKNLDSVFLSFGVFKIPVDIGKTFPPFLPLQLNE